MRITLAVVAVAVVVAIAGCKQKAGVESTGAEGVAEQTAAEEISVDLDSAMDRGSEALVTAGGDEEETAEEVADM